MAGGVCAVIVTYRANRVVLAQAIAAITPQVDGVVVFDNGSEGPETDALSVWNGSPGVVLLRGEGNVGLAEGFNRGIAHARSAGYRFVLLLDQDSVASPGMVETLVAAHHELSETCRVGAVGPQFHDPRSGEPGPFVRIGFPFNRKTLGSAGDCVDCDFLISSGSLIPLAVLEQVGDMDGALFIDNVDLDWSFRARHAGYRLFGVCDAYLQHSIGDRVLPSRWVRTGVLVHKPARLYYMMRNRLLLYRRPHTSWTWVAQDLLRLGGKFLRMSLLIPPRFPNLLAMLGGLRDGLAGRDGPRREGGG